MFDKNIIELQKSNVNQLNIMKLKNIEKLKKNKN